MPLLAKFTNACNQRLILSVMGFFALINAYTMRICLSLAIVEMVGKHLSNETDSDEYCPIGDDFHSSVEGTEPQFDWSEKTQGIILSSFFWGYVVTHIPGGYLAERFGGKWVLSLGILSTSIFTLITPLAIELGGADWLISLRFFEGLGEGTTFPAVSVLLSQWIPLQERGKYGSLVFGGGQVGTILANVISGFLIDHFKSWKSIFYFWGIMGILWFIFFTIMCYSDPQSHPYITKEEKEFLRAKLGRIEREKDLPPAPYYLIITNPAMLAIIFAQIGHDFGFFIMVTDLPKYMSDILHFNIKENGIYSALPFGFMWIVSVTTGCLGDWIIKHKYLSITNSRKLFTTIASIFPAFLLLGASYAGCNKVIVVLLFVLGMAFMGTYYPGMKVNSLDLSPNYAGSLMGITNGFGALTGIAGPYFVGIMTPNRSILEWRLVFWVAFFIFNITNLIYIIWASGLIQQFDDPVFLRERKAKTTEKSIEKKAEEE